MESKRFFNEKGITLVVLVITIAIMLILAGIAIGILGGENGLISKVNYAKNKYSISETKEKLEMAIIELRIEEEGKGETLTKEDLPKMNNDEIDVRNTEKFPIEVICGKYKFNVDENFIVTYIGDANETIVTYTTNPEGYTNQAEVNILVKVSNSKGIKLIELLDEETGKKIDGIIGNGKTEIGYDTQVTKNGTYKIKVIDMENNELIKDIVIDKIDKLEPLDFTPLVEKLKSTSLVITENVQDAETDGISTKSGIERYEYYVNGNKYESTENNYKVTGLTRNTTYSIYVIVYDKAGNSKKSNTITATTTKGEYPTLTLDGISNKENLDLAEDALALEAYDGNFDTYDLRVAENGYNWAYVNVEPECWGKYFNIYYCTPNSSFLGFISIGNRGYGWNNLLAGYLAEITGTAANELCTRSVLIPENSYSIDLSAGNNDHSFHIYEIWCGEENLTGNVYSNDSLPPNFR